MNELLFFSHILFVLLFLGFSLRLGLKAMTSFLSLSAILANLFVLKQTALFGWQATCSDVFTVGGILGLNLIQETYGRDAARCAIHVSFLGIVMYVVMSQFHLCYIPSEFDATQRAYNTIMGQMPRIVAASLGVYYFVQRFDVSFFAFLRRFPLPLSIRLVISAIVGQAIDTVLFTFFGLYGLIASVFDVIVVSFLVKCSIIIAGGPIAAFLQRFVRKEGSFSRR
jgi:uncharacterized integral membrane protein (TIGR00697 family)